jgi:hypothetical protein
MGEQQWYSDREMFEMIQELKTELTETRITIKKYNGLWEKFENADNRLTVLESQAQGRASVGRSVRDWGGWFVGIGGLVIAGLALWQSTGL